MPTLPVYNTEGAQTGELEVPEALFSVAPSEALIHEVVVADLAAKRRGTAHTKTRAEVAGSGRKLWRQKGTGRARVGDRNPPSRVGGGVAAGPRTRSYQQRLPRRLKAEALRGALGARSQAGEVILIDSLDLPEVKTRALARVLQAVGAEGSVLLVLDRPDQTVWRCGRNIPGLHLTDAYRVNAYDVLAARRVVITKQALQGLEARLL
jgi:large subunit ribosomal protein L4